MIPVDQTILHDPKNGKVGDCFRACVASLLELPPETVPHFAELRRDLWFAEFTKWLEDLGYSAIFIDVETIQKNVAEPTMVVGDDAIAIAGGIANGRTVPHSVLWSFAGGGRMVHDPHPSRRGIREIRDLTFIVKGVADEVQD